MQVKEIEIQDIDFGVRKRQQYTGLSEFWSVIQDVGLLHPIVVVKQDKELPYLLVAGGRRTKAYMIGMQTTIMAQVWDRPLNTLELARLELSENLDRADLTWEEEVAAKRRIHELSEQIAGDKKHTIADTARSLGESPSNVVGDIALAKAIEEVPELALCKTKSDAKKRIAYGREAYLKELLTKRIAKKAVHSGVDQLRANIRKSYVVGDTFELVKKIPDNSIDLIDLDPPYGIDLGQSLEREKDGSTEGFEEWSLDKLERRTKDILRECARVLKSTGWIIFWHSIWYSQATYRWADEQGLLVSRAPLFWVKPGKYGRTNHPSTSFVIDYEVCHYARGKEAHLNEQGPSSVFSFKPQLGERIHPTEKPIPLMKAMFSKFCGPGARVFVPFLGGGNSLFAANELGMQAFGFDNNQAFKDGFVLRVEDWIPPGQQLELKETDDD